jgi:DNA-binding NtrC family response regulator
MPRNFSLTEEKSPALCVLVVDDELLIRWSIGEMLRQSGHTVIEAADGASAIQALASASGPVHVVLLDYRLPDSDDLSLLGTIRQISPGSAVVLMSAYGTPEIAQAALRLGVCEVLHKPFDMHDMPGIVHRARVARPH